MAINTKAIKNRIKSVGNTKKITKAMEMVSAAKMRKAVEAALNTRSYALMARELLDHLSKLDKKANYELLSTRKVENILVILISSNRGLCGSFNANIMRKAALVLKNKQELAKNIKDNGEVVLPAENVKLHILAVGKKSADFARKQKYDLTAVFDNLTEAKSFEEILPISKIALDGYREGIYDKVMVLYTDYKSSLTQEAKAKQLLPVSEKDINEMLNDLGRNEGGASLEERAEIKEEAAWQGIDNYIFEPNEKEIVDYILPRLVEVQLFQSILESAASEHSARMMAMRNASDAAGEMINELNLTFNKARQAAITQEIAEIAGGAAALG